MAAHQPVIGDDGVDGMRTRQTRGESLKRKRSSFIEGSRSKTRTGNEFTPKSKSKSPLLSDTQGKSTFSSAVKKQIKAKVTAAQQN